MKPALLLAVPLLLAAQSAEAQNASGETLFKQRCQACHTIAAGQAGVIAPNLAGVVGRKAAAVTGYNYSSALKASGLIWTKANLDKFLSGPMKLVPGTKMVITLPSAQDRAAVLAYLATKK